MMVNRRKFAKGGLAALGFLALPSRLWSAPAGWKPKRKPKLVFGVLSDTHMRTHYDGVSFYEHYDIRMDDTPLKAALEYFKREKVDAVVHCGDLTDRGIIRTMELYKAAWDEVFTENPKPVHLYATGNHDVDGGDYGWPKAITRSEDPAVYRKICLEPNLKPEMERIWGEPYDDIWHKVVKGYHFFGFGWGNNPDDRTQIYRGRLYHDYSVEGKGCSPFVHKGLWMTELVRREREAGRLDPNKPFFTVYHCMINRYDRREALINTHLAKALGLKPGQFCNGLGFFGHGHRSNADWFCFWDNKACFPSIECGSLALWKGCGGGWMRFAEGYGDGTAQGIDNRPTALLVEVYDGFVVLRSFNVEVKPERRIGKVIPDLVLPLKGFVPDRHPAQLENLTKIVGTPEFAYGAVLKVTCDGTDVKVEIPRAARGKKGLRAYGYNVAVVGREGATVWKNAFAKGYSYGESFPPDGGVTTVTIPKKELPSGRMLTFRVFPSSEFGERGKPIKKIVMLGRQAVHARKKKL